MLNVLNVERFKSLTWGIKGSCVPAPPQSCPRKRRSNTSMMSSTAVWNAALADPHLVRLADLLAFIEGEVHNNR